LSIWTIYYDQIHEGDWFSSLHPALGDADILPMSGAVDENGSLRHVLNHDRPDIVLAYNRHPVVVLERTTEVPSGHNVGQRFARLAAAAEAGAPLVYFGPYVARKHGGKTAGPRWMNLRLFQALDRVATIHNAAVTTINWPVDGNYELIRSPSKDTRVRDYLELLVEIIRTDGLLRLNQSVARSYFQARQLDERRRFCAGMRTAGLYEQPPPSVRILSGQVAAREFRYRKLARHEEVVLYRIGARYLRSDPYAGSALLYRYLYVLGEQECDRILILHLPHVTQQAWDDAVRSPRRKDVRLFSAFADGMIFADGHR
jgi:hypothetical protein